MKVRKASMSASYEIVTDDTGDMRTDEQGCSYSYEPLPIARIPVGYGRSDEQARELAEYICEVLNEQGEYIAR